MFFEADQVLAALNCKSCEEKLNEPILLPCGVTICSFCEKYIAVLNGKFKCLCNKEHTMPEDGLPFNQSLKQLLTIQPTEVYRSKAVESLKSELNEIPLKIEKISYCLKTNRAKQINEHCVYLKKEVSIASDEAIQEIKTFKQEFFQEIEKFESENNENSKEVDKTIREKLTKTLEEYDLFYREWTLYLKQAKIDDEKISDAAQQSVLLRKRAENEIKELQNYLFEWIPVFKKNKKILNRSIIGSLVDSMHDSSILTNHQFQILLNLCEFPAGQKFKLLYRATVDGFEVPTFHKKCDGQFKTLTIIKSFKENIFGGFTETDWSGCGFKNDPNAFIFSFKNPEKQQLKIKCNDFNAAVYCNPICGPTFGQDDIFVSNNSNMFEQSYSNAGSTYPHPAYAYKSKEARSFFNGCYLDKISEIEVFSKI
jgi:hypothetical protein